VDSNDESEKEEEEEIVLFLIFFFSLARRRRREQQRDNDNDCQPRCDVAIMCVCVYICMHTRVEFLLKRKGVCPFFFSDFFSRHTPFLPQKISQISLYWAFVVDFFCFFSSRSIHHHTSLGVCIFAPFFLVVWKGCVIIF